MCEATRGNGSQCWVFSILPGVAAGLICFAEPPGQSGPEIAEIGPLLAALVLSEPDRSLTIALLKAAQSALQALS